MSSRVTKAYRRKESTLNNFELVSVFRAFDGTKFYGDQDGENKCREYNDSLIDALEEEMVGNVSIYNTAYFFDGLRNAYIKFNTVIGKNQFITWCKYNYIDLKSKDDIVNILELDKWYKVTVDNDHYYTVDTTDIDQIIANLLDLKKNLDDIDKETAIIL